MDRGTKTRVSRIGVNFPGVHGAEPVPAVIYDRMSNLGNTFFESLTAICRLS